MLFVPKRHFFSRKNDYKLKIQDSWKHVMSTYIVTFFVRVINSNISPNTATKNCPTSLRNNFIHSKWTGFKQFSNTHATKFVFAIVFGLIMGQGFIFKVVTLIVNQAVCWINRGSLAGTIKMAPTKIKFSNRISLMSDSCLPFAPIFKFLFILGYVLA